MTVQFFDARLPDRFWEKVQPEPNSGCWLWIAHISDGYGRIQVDGRVRGAHRFAYESLVGAVPSELNLDHLCRTRCCVNPAHLEPVTPGENSRRGETGKKSGAMQRAKTHCPRGHKYDDSSTYIDARGCRSCRTCKVEAQRENRRAA